MSTLYIKTNTQGIILKSFIRQIDGLEVVLLNEHNVPLARYQFNNRSNIDYIEYKNSVHATPEVIRSLRKADLIIIGIGSLYTSVIPNLLDKEVVKVLKSSKAKKMYVSNIMTEHGETDDYTVSDCIKEINKYADEPFIDVVLANNGQISKDILKLYKEEKSKPIPLDEENLQKMNIKVISDNLVKIVNKQVRHDNIRTALDIFTYINNSGDV